MKTPEWIPCFVSFDEGPEYAAWHKRKFWNGWAMPMLPESSVREWIASWNGSLPENDPHMLRMEGEDLIIPLQASNDDQDVRISPVTIQCPAGPVQVWDLGQEGFCWNIREDGDAE